MDLKKRTKEELEDKIKSLENFIASKGIGSQYLDKMKKTQRNVNLFLFAGALTTIVGVAAWALLHGDDE